MIAMLKKVYLSLNGEIRFIAIYGHHINFSLMQHTYYNSIVIHLATFIHIFIIFSVYMLQIK